jgi:hypothetical protein
MSLYYHYPKDSDSQAGANEGMVLLFVPAIFLIAELN